MKATKPKLNRDVYQMQRCSSAHGSDTAEARRDPCYLRSTTPKLVSKIVHDSMLPSSRAVKLQMLAQDLVFALQPS